MKTRARIVFSLALALAPASALAHPGHGKTDPHSFQHYRSEPVHILALGGAFAALVGALVFHRRERRARSKFGP